MPKALLPLSSSLDGQGLMDEEPDTSSTESLSAEDQAILDDYLARRGVKPRALEGEHPAFGPVSLRQLLATWVAHDLGHTAQIARVMAKQYRDAVGPWRQYLPIMDR